MFLRGPSLPSGFKLVRAAKLFSLILFWVAMSSQYFFGSFHALIGLVHSILVPSTEAASMQACVSSTFSSLYLGDKIQVQSLDITAHIGFEVPTLTLPPTTRQQAASVDICLLTINYTHTGEDDSVTTWVGLPLNESSWNGRFLMNGGGGWLVGDQDRTVSAVGSGYSSASTNGGHNGENHDMPSWGLRGNGSVNWPALEDFSSRAIVEAVRFGKRATELYFGAKPRFSYWNGCSAGGRQGHGKDMSNKIYYSLPCSVSKMCCNLLTRRQWSPTWCQKNSVVFLRALRLSTGPNFSFRKLGAILLPSTWVCTIFMSSIYLSYLFGRTPVLIFIS